MFPKKGPSQKAYGLSFEASFKNGQTVTFPGSVTHQLPCRFPPLLKLAGLIVKLGVFVVFRMSEKNTTNTKGSKATRKQHKNPGTFVSFTYPS